MDSCIGDSTVQKEDLLIDLAVNLKKQPISAIQRPKKRVIVLAGPTSVGKSAFAMELAKMLGGEIVTADSMQVYEGMDIGTAKPTFEERQEVPHHLLDIRKLSERFNVVDFYHHAKSMCEVILSKGGVPIVVGGSGFYLHAFIYGPPEGPPPNEKVRQALIKEMEKKGLEDLYEKLQIQDPEYAKTITPKDKRKILRALEIIEVTGRPVSKMKWKQKLLPLNFDFRCWFLYRPKESIYERINKRCEEMLEHGFLEEVKTLEAEGIRDNPSLSHAIGYRQALDYLASPQSDADYEAFVQAFKKGTRAYVKRQFTWFRKERLFRWLDLEMHDPEVALDIVRQDYEYGI